MDRDPVIVGMGILLAILLGFIGCGIYLNATEPKSGTVTHLEYHQAWMSTECTTSGKVTTCVPITHPECYEVDYVNGHDTGDACVAPTEYPLYRVGDHFPRNTQLQ